jgi:hypothetical protein
MVLFPFSWIDRLGYCGVVVEVEWWFATAASSSPEVANRRSF